MPTSSTSPPAAARARVDVAPPAVDYGDGELAIRLSAAAGLPLEPWQQDGLRTWMARGKDGQYAASTVAELCPRQNGKSAQLMARALAGFLLLGEPMVLWTAHEVKTSMRSWKDLRRLLRTLGTRVNDHLIEVGGIPIKVSAGNGAEGFERLDTGAEIRIAARSKGSGRGFTVDTLILDEAFALEDLHLEALLPMQAACPDPQVFYASSPPLNGSTGEPLFDLRETLELETDDELAYRDWGSAMTLDELMAMPAPARRALLDDRALWASTNPAFGGGRVREKSILKLRRRLSERGFAREILGMWPERVAKGGPRPITPELWAARGDKESRPAGRVRLAVDASPGGRSAAIATSGRRADERLHVKVVDFQPGTGWVVQRAAEHCEQWDLPREVTLDPASPAGALIADFQASGFQVHLVGGREMAQACGALVNDLKDDRARHCAQEALDEAVEGATTRPVSGAWAWDRRDPNADICPLVAVTLAAHAMRLRGAEPEAPAVPLVAWR